MSELFGNMRYGNDAAINGLKDLINHLDRDNLTVVEVGSYAGESAEIMLSTGKVSKLYCVDPWMPDYDKTDATSSAGNMAASEAAFDARLSSDARVVKLKKTVQEAIASGDLPPFVDLVYVDACHRYRSVVEDIRATCNMCRTLAGHDFWIDDVKRAVTGIYGEPSATFQDSSWLIENPGRKCCVVIPVYKALSPDERESLDQAIAVLGKNHTLTFICGQSFDLGILDAKYRDIPMERFPDASFEGLYQYNQLCCDRNFYARFVNYTHILIYQLDGYVYRDDLFERWMKYEYVGAPWCLTCGTCVAETTPLAKVGNGGVSLRHVKACLDLMLRMSPLDPTFPEDWVIFKTAPLRKPTCIEACEFSLESMARRAYRKTGRVPSFSHKLGGWDPATFKAFKEAYLRGTVDTTVVTAASDPHSAISADEVRELFDMNGLDKGGSAHDYSAVYAEHFSRLRAISGRRPRIVIIGAFNGGNLASFKEAVPDAEIYCIDKDYTTPDSRFTVIEGDGYGSAAWEQIPKDIDLIADDGSHVTTDMIRGIPYFREHLAIDGTIIIEDITTDENANRVSAFLPGSEAVQAPKISRYDDDHLVVYRASLRKQLPVSPKILFITGAGCPDYQNDALFSGLVELGADVTDSKYLWFLSPVSDDQKLDLYGRGFTYAGKLPDRSGISRDEDEIRQRIADRYYDAVIYGSIWRCRDYFDLVRQSYPRERIILVDGEDGSQIFDQVCDSGIYFKRELVRPVSSRLLPISFAVGSRQFNKPVYPKTVDFAPQVPGNGYAFSDEDSYYRAYREARFALTWKKGGWDCMRHYEIVAAGSVPFFTDIAYCPQDTMWNWPRQLQAEANTLACRWLSGHRDETAYDRLLDAFTAYGRESLTTETLARYVLSHVG